MSDRLLKTVEVWKHFRPPLNEWAKAREMKRLRSSPPAYARELEHGWLTLFAQGSRGGIDHHIGGQFTLDVQVGARSMPMVHVAEGIATHRVCTLWTPEQQAEALEIHNRVVDKRVAPPPSSYLHEIYPDGRAQELFLRRLEELPSLDYWMAFVDATDVRAWADFLVRHLDSWTRAASKRGFGRERKKI